MAITAPAHGASFVSPEPIALTATATAGGAAIASVAYYVDAIAVGQASASPYAFTWTGAQPGTYSLMALAMDATGGRRLSAPITVTVGPAQPPAVAITTPGNGAAYTAPATIALAANATAAGGATIAKVEYFNGPALVASATSAPYTATWSNVVAGSYTLTAKATDSRTAMATSSPVAVTVTGAAPALAISAAAGLDGSTVNETTVLVNGTITAPANSGVTVNGVLATVGTDNQFSANDVPLSAGANAITLTVTTQDGASASQAITINSSGVAAAFMVSLDEPDGIAPHTVTFTVSGGATPVATIEFDVDGNGTVDVTTQGIPAAGVEATYSSAGTVRPRVTFKDASGSVIYTTTKQVHIADPIAKYNILKGVYTDIVSRLSAGNGTSASGLFVEDRRTDYQDFFAQIGSNLASVAAQLGQLRGGATTGNRGELVVVRETSEGQTAFTIHVIRGADGIWRIESM
ncbi:MAG: hypothetical protein IPH30_10415 [Betaproteobacteria bacterium]|nr:hypothetical protein [Betaproteobacteria bacterium]